MLEQLKLELRQFKVIDCGLWHEQVEREEQSIMPKLSVLPGDVRYKRMKFCDKSTRNHLGCAHTNVRNEAIRKVKEIGTLMLEQAEGEPSLAKEIRCTCSAYCEKLQAFEMKIAETDIKKSGLELDHAAVCEKLTEHETEALKEQCMHVEQEIRSVIGIQKQHNNEIRALQKEMLVKIEALEMRMNSIRPD
ncbi:hypothetical protein ACFL2V_15710 [Pseudomonadota bacterium]